MKRWILPIGLIAVTIIISLLVYGRMPDQVPIHWNVNGEVDRYASKPFALFFMPAMMLGVFLLIKLAPHIDPKKANLKKNLRDIDSINFFILLALLAVHVFTIFYGLGYDFDMSIIAPLIAGGLFVIIGNYMPRFKHNYSVGLKTPWTLADEEVWKKSNLISGRYFFFGGLVMILSVFLPNMWMLIIFFTALAVSAIAPVIVSFILFRKKRSA